MGATRAGRLAAGAWGLCVVVAAGTAPAQALTVTPVGGFALSSNGTDAGDLSGLTWAGGSQFYAVSNGTNKLYPLSVGLNATTGAITSAALSPGVILAGGADVEGVAYDPTDGRVFVSNETGSAIRKHAIATGAATGSVTVPPVYGGIRGNLGLESLSRQAGAGALWTANEEALTSDGPRSTTAAGTLVRLQKFDAAGNPAGQFAYQTDPISADGPLISNEMSGVSDVLALPDGRLLVLERELGGSVIPDLRSRLYLVDFSGATDTASIASLSSGGFQPAGKQLLWQGDFPATNYEGIALGPQLSNGDHVLLLISDNGNGLSQSLYSLRLSGVIPEPASLSLLGFGALLLHRRRRR